MSEPGRVSDPLRIGIPGAARLTERSLVGPAREGAAPPPAADDAVAARELADACYEAAGLGPRTAPGG